MYYETHVSTVTVNVVELGGRFTGVALGSFRLRSRIPPVLMIVGIRVARAEDLDLDDHFSGGTSVGCCRRSDRGLPDVAHW